MWHNPAVNVDGTLYIEQAKALYEGRFAEILSCYPYPTIYSLYIALAHFFIKDWVLAGRVVSLIFWTVSFYFSYKLIKLFFKELSIIALSLLYLSLLPNFLIYSYGVFRDQTAWAFFLGGLFYIGQGVLSYKNHININEFLKAAGFFILAFLCRFEYIVFIFVPTAFILKAIIDQKEKRNLLLSSLFILTLVSFIIFEFFFHFGFISFTKERMVDFYHNYSTLQAELSSLAHNATSGFNSHFFYEAKNLIWWNAFGLLLKKFFEVITPIGFIFLIIGLSNSNKSSFKENTPMAIWKIMWLFVLLCVFLLYIQSLTSWSLTKRHICILLFPILPFIGKGIKILIQFFKKKGFTERIAIGIVLFSIIAMLLPLNLKSNIRLSKAELKMIGEYISSISQQNRPLLISGNMKRTNLISFYANLNKKGNTCFNNSLLVKKAVSPKENFIWLKSINFDYYVWNKKDSPIINQKTLNKLGLKPVGEFNSKKYGLILILKRQNSCKQ